ncbi:DUF6684 family protein [Halobellus salinisoli]|uniref:DUF6684 family protein n=1 Tax=Halobellus salinisoli TaxID=3108500 RepID=UPI0030080F56
MANKIFDRDTLLDLTVNVVPLFIIAFFVVAFAVVTPFGIDPLASAIQFGLLVVPFVMLAVLTYFSGKAIAGAELRDEVYLPGQAGVRGAEPLEESEGAATELDDESPSAVEGDAENVEGDADDDVQTDDGDAASDEVSTSESGSTEDERDV